MRLNHAVSRTQLARQIKRSVQAGVSLLEFVIGLVLLAIILLGVTLFYANYTRQLDPVFQFRAVSLAEAVAEQVIAVKYDANNDPYQKVRCEVTQNAPACSDTPILINEPYDITNFTVVDDFQLWCDNGAINGEVLAEQLAIPHSHLYNKFSINTCVELKQDLQSNSYKNVTINITIDSDATLSFILRRYNIR